MEARFGSVNRDMAVKKLADLKEAAIETVAVADQRNERSGSGVAALASP
jgi:hypothetical protein